MTDPYYVMLTGAKNNAGDFLIAERAKNLLRALRPDRAIVASHRWEPIDAKRLEIVNGASALLLSGGPALQPAMYPDVYPLVEELSDIKVPIIGFGIGWNSRYGGWRDAATYSFTERTRQLLSRMEKQAFASSLRDYHSALCGERNGFANFRVTGCPALFAGTLPPARAAPFDPGSVRRIGFSLGVEYTRSRQFAAQTKVLVACCRRWFPRAELVVAFHHGTDKSYLASPGSRAGFWRRQRRFLEWLDASGIDHIDISGSFERLAAFYETVDLHVGYRVHAHIFMLSASRPSILIAEDGRGLALREVVGGAILNGYWTRAHSPVIRAMQRGGIDMSYRMNEGIADELGALMQDGARMLRHAETSRALIASHLGVIRQTVVSWP